MEIFSFDIEQQEAGVALHLFAQKSGQQVLFPRNRLKGITTNKLVGDYNLEDALAILLRGTGLRPVFSGSRILTIVVESDPHIEDDSVKFTKKKVSGLAALIAALIDGNSVAHAQESNNSEATIDEVVVIGSYAGGLQKALDLKRSADSIADAIIAADIGKLPATNVAEALQHVPGVTINREAGEGQFVSVRGLGPNFQSVTFNGAPIAFNENVRNSDQSGRQFRFNVIPSDLIGGIVVTKAPTADLIDGGIGSNLDLKTISPLEKNSFVAAQIFANYEEQSEETTPDGSLSAGWKNDDKTFGVMGGISYQERKVRFDRLQTTGYSSVTFNGQTARMPNNIQTTVEEEHRERTSFLGGLEWKPVDDLSVNMNALYSKFNNDIAENRIIYTFAGDKKALAAVDPASVVINDGIVTAATIRNDGGMSRNEEVSAQEHENNLVNLGLKYTLGEWVFKPSVSHSEATSGLTTPLERMNSDTKTGAGLIYGFDLGNDPVGDVQINSLTTNLDLHNPNAIPFTRYTMRPINVNDDDTTGLLDISRTLNLKAGSFEFIDFRFGGQKTERSRDYQRRDRTLVTKPGVTVDGSFYDNIIPSDAFSKTIGNSQEGWVGPNFSKFSKAFTGAKGEFDNVFVQADDLVPTNADLQNSYAIDESVSALYGRLDFESLIVNTPFTGNAGLRWVSTDTVVKGTVLSAKTEAGKTTTIVTPMTFNGNYAEVLPSLNVNFKLQDDLLLRVGLSKSLTRPSLADLRTSVVPDSSFTSDIYERGETAITSRTSIPTGVGGNPQLKPYVSTNFDISLEWYFTEFGALSVSGFHKDISNFIASVEHTETLVFAVDPSKNNGISTLPADLLIARPRNVGDATISGVEFSYSDRLSNGLGLSTNLTLVDASVDNNGTKQLPQGVSDVTYSVSPFYENGPFEIHFSWTWRSKQNTTANISIGTAAAVDGQQQGAADFGTLDFGASYQLNDPVQFFVKGVNLTAERQAAFIGRDDQFMQAQSYGRTINLGVKVVY